MTNNTTSFYAILMPRPTVAQQLCHDIVEPALKVSANNVKSIISRKSIKSSSSKNESKPSHSVHIEKKRIINKILPSENNKSRINSLKSKETVIRKHFIDTAINTLISGPLRCDNYCVTMVRKRDQNPCKCAQKKVNYKASNKIIQTLNRRSFSSMDKACAHHIESVNCGTQFLDKHNSILKSTIKKSKSRTNINFKMPYQESLDSNSGIYRSNRVIIQDNQPEEYHRFERVSSYGGKRWALSNYPRRGPDF